MNYAAADHFSKTNGFRFRVHVCIMSAVWAIIISSKRQLHYFATQEAIIRMSSTDREEPRERVYQLKVADWFMSLQNWIILLLIKLSKKSWVKLGKSLHLHLSSTLCYFFGFQFLKTFFPRVWIYRNLRGLSSIQTICVAQVTFEKSSLQQIWQRW